MRQSEKKTFGAWLQHAGLPSTKRLAVGLLCVVSWPAMAFSASPAAAKSDQKFHTERWLDDYAVLKAGIEKNYANLLWFAAPESALNLPNLNKTTLALIRASNSEADAESALRSFVLRFRDGHFKALETLSEPTEAPVEPPRMSLASLNVDQACGAVAEGISSDPMYSLPFESIPGFSQLGGGPTNAFRYGIYSNNEKKKIALLRIQSFRDLAYPSVCSSVWGGLVRAKVDVTARAIQDEMPQAWLAALADTIAMLKAEKPDALLIDLGGNGGGNDSGDWATRLFTDRPIMSPPLLIGAANAVAYLDEQLANLNRSTEVAPASRPDLQSLVEQTVQTYKQAKVALLGKTCDMSWVWREQRPWQPTRCGALVPAGFSSGVVATLSGLDEKLTDYVTYFYWPGVAHPYHGAWSGKVYILTDNRVGSSAEMFAAILQDNGVARIVGTPSKGAGCGNMRKIKPVTLPHSKLRFQMPDCVRLRYDGSSEVEGIRPDIPVAPAIGESPRARTVRLLESIAAELPANP